MLLQSPSKAEASSLSSIQGQGKSQTSHFSAPLALANGMWHMIIQLIQ